MKILIVRNNKLIKNNKKNKKDFQSTNQHKYFKVK